MDVLKINDDDDDDDDYVIRPAMKNLHNLLHII